MKKIITTDAEAQAKLLKGVDMVADIVKRTLGPSGSNVVYTTNGTPTVTNDGVSIALQVLSNDEIEQVGIDLIKQSSLQTNNKIGDGTTTSIVLAQAIAHAGFNEVNKGRSALEVRTQIMDECEQVVKFLEEQASPVEGDMLRNVAYTSVENKEYGDLIANTLERVGPDGVVMVDYSQELGVTATFTEGLEVSQGWISPYMVDEEGVAVIEDAYVLLCDSKLSSFQEFTPVMEKLVKEKGVRKLLVVCEKMETHFLANAVLNKTKGAFDLKAIATPFIDKEQFLEDISIVTGAKIVGTTGLLLDKVTTDDLGYCSKIIISQDSTLFIGGSGDTSNAVERLRIHKNTLTDSYSISKAEKRIARLVGGVAVIKVGASTEAETTYIKLKIDDAVAATKAAMKHGVVRGGGLELMEMYSDDYLIGESLNKPYEQIQENAGGNIVIPDSVLDPVMVTITALRNACSVAGILLTTTAVIADVKKYEL